MSLKKIPNPRKKLHSELLLGPSLSDERFATHGTPGEATSLCRKGWGLTHLPLQYIQRDSPKFWLLGAKVGNGLSCFVEGCQQGVRAVLRLNADLLVGQVNVELHSCRRKETGMWEGEAGPFHPKNKRGQPP